MPLNKSRVQGGWLVWTCLFFSQYLRVQSVLADECFWLSCLSISAPYLSNQPQIVCEGAFLLPMLCTQVPSSFFSPCVCLSVVASSLLSNLSCKHTSASSKCGHTGFLPTSSVWLGKLPHFLRWESTERRPLVSHILCICIALSSLLVSVCGAPIFWPQCLRGGGLWPCPFPWCVVVCFNGDFSLSSFFPCLCISAAAYTCLRGAIIGRGALAGTLMCE